jgi:hypothetical protein
VEHLGVFTGTEIDRVDFEPSVRLEKAELASDGTKQSCNKHPLSIDASAKSNNDSAIEAASSHRPKPPEFHNPIFAPPSEGS